MHLVYLEDPCFFKLLADYMLPMHPDNDNVSPWLLNLISSAAAFVVFCIEVVYHIANNN